MRLPSFLHPISFHPVSPHSPSLLLRSIHTHLCLTLPPPLSLTFLLTFTISLLLLVVTKEWTKVHRNGHVQHEASTDIDGDYFYFKEGSTGVIKILKCMNPVLNYYEYLIVNKGQKGSVGIGVHMPLNCTTSGLPTFDT